jgi:hypothetical protein
MTMTRSRFLRIIKISLFVLIVLVVAGYATWRSLSYARGPGIKVFQPLSGVSLNTKTVDVVGRAERVSSLTVNGNPISIDETGNFKETIAVFPGVNIITLSATDQFGRKGSEQIQILGL